MCSGSTFPQVAETVPVLSNQEVAPSVYLLTLARSENIPASLPGQFYMLRSQPSGVLLGRPISVFEETKEAVSFLILNKGRGTAELCSLLPGSSVDIIGPSGNRFMSPAELGMENARVALIGGGIGVAPVAGLALGLTAGGFDFYASFRSAPYGIERAGKRAKRLFITTEDGSSGVKGMLPAVFVPSQYDLVYACGPTAMLKYVQETCASGEITAYLSLEQRMACGAGACLGCTIRTVNGNRRCCVDGPVFKASEVLW